MCGISVVYNPSGNKPDSPTSLLDELQRSLELIRHRGPDDSGIYISPDNQVGLGHVRLSIIDLAHGKQPLSDDTETVHCVVNGELYDYATIRADLESKGAKFKTQSDSELVLQLYKQYGLALTAHMRGEFAFVLYDQKRRLILAARDRFGIKPLYYTRANGRLLVASEIKAFLPFGFQAQWNVESIVHQGEYADDRTIFQGVYKLPPGHYFTYDRHSQMRVVNYWDHSYHAQTNEAGIGSPYTVEDAVANVRQLVVDSVRIRLRSDVPFAVNLSGGIDSAAVAGIAAAAMKETDPNARLNVFTLAFPDRADVDEAPVARRMAESIGAIMHLVRPTEKELVDAFEPSVWHSEAPLMYLHGAGKILLSKAVRDKGFKVVLSGEGADELFGGYNYLLPDYLRQPDPFSEQVLKMTLPTELERMMTLKAIVSRPRPQDHVSLSDPAVASSVAGEMLGGLITHRMIGITGPPSNFYTEKVLELQGTPDTGRSIAEFFRPQIREDIASGRWHSLHGALYVVQKTALGNLILNHLGDRPEMFNSIEGRPPFLDHKLAEYVNTLPPSLKIRPFLTTPDSAETPRSWNYVEKWILREAVRPFVTQEIAEIKKSMYNSPIPRPTSTLEGKSTPLQAHLASRITKEAVEKVGFLRWDTVQATLADFLERPDSPADGGLDPNGRRLLFVLSFIVLQEKFHIPSATVP
ncbi:putative asparagine synthase [Mycena capillaripes]|nr:putative asparagine synthase [Mycena capillaripes]